MPPVDFSAARSRLAASIRLTGDIESSNRLVRSVANAYDEYRWFAIAYASPKSRITKIRQMLRNVGAFEAEWNGSNDALRGFLRSCGVAPASHFGAHSGAIPDQAEMEICRGLEFAIGQLELAPSDVKASNVPLRVFVNRLVGIYMEHHPDNGTYKAAFGTKRQLRAFIKAALEAAGLDYPDPSNHTDRFDDLLTAKRII